MSIGWSESSSSSSVGSGYYYDWDHKHVRRRLKSLNRLKREFPFKETYDGLEDRSRSWLISDDMAPKFGDDNYYSFELLENIGDYTHVHSPDGYYYHELWFIDEHEENEPVIKLEDKDFLL